MARKKKKKSNSSNGFKYTNELIGLILVLIGILGIGFGPLGIMIKKLAIFLTGELWFLILGLFLFFGFNLIIKRSIPKLFSLKLAGIYILFLIILVLFHFEFIENMLPNTSIIDTTFNNYNSRMLTLTPQTELYLTGTNTIPIGTGMLGAVLATGCASLFGSTGTIIFLIALGIFALIIVFDFIPSDLDFKREPRPKKEKKSKYEDDEYEDDEEEEEEPVVDNRVVINSVEELKRSKEPIKAPTEKQNNMEQLSIPEVKKDNHIYRLPSMSLLEDPVKIKKSNNDFVRNHRLVLEGVLGDFGIRAKVVDIHIGPSVTQYEIQIPNGTKVSKILTLNKEIALALAAKDVRIQAPIPGKSTIGIELPNPNITPVRIKEIVNNVPQSQLGAKILASLGKDIMGRVQTMDITKTPHLLVAGATGSGKSVCINSMIATILMKYRPDEVKLVMVDPKKVELSNYNGVPHLICPVVTNPKKASVALQKIVVEMERRYETFSETGVKNIATYNDWIDRQNDKDPSVILKKMPYIVVIIDELADLMLVAAKEVEDSIMRITQMARAAGIHLIVATQRPSTDVITGVVKANIPSRISFAVASQIDSRTILDSPGAEKLLGKGDMLYLPMGENAPMRIQGCFISDEEIQRVIDYVCKEQIAQYDNTLTEEPEQDHNPVSGDKENYEDPLYDEIVDFAIQTGKISASLLQRRFRLGYNRAARVIDLLEDRGIVGPSNGSKPREVLVKLQETDYEEEE